MTVDSASAKIIEETKRRLAEIKDHANQGVEAPEKAAGYLCMIVVEVIDLCEWFIAEAEKPEP